jgi:HD-GYP domain-containing protein (c-di-GMP phosphodiesterase class II)
MISKRPYREPLPFNKALEILNNGGGTIWDVRLIEIFMEIIKSRQERLAPQI